MLFRSSIRSARSRVTRHCPTLELLEDRTLLTFARPVNYLVLGASPQSVAAGDFNNDKLPDLVTANQQSNNISVLLGNGDGTFATARNYPVDRGPTYAGVGDFNNDSNLDIVVAARGSNSLALLLGNGDGTFRDAVYFFAGQAPVHIAVGDFDDNGTLDAAVALVETSNISVLLGNGDGTFRPPVLLLSGQRPECVQIADVNRDGWLDLTTAHSFENHGSVLLGNGDGTFRQRIVHNGIDQQRCNLVDDFNDDERPDVVATNLSRDQVSIFLGSGDATFFSRREFAVGTRPNSLGSGDFNADGRVDLVVANSGSNNASLLLGNGNGTFRTAVNYLADSGPSGLIVGDWNFDGLPDVAISNANSNTVSILLNDIDAADHFRVNAPTSATAGAVLSITVSARSRSDNVATGYRGTVRFTSSDAAATLPADYMYTEADQGSRTFNVTLRTAGSRTVTVTDTAAGFITGTATILVNPAPASVLVVAGFPSSVIAGDVEVFSVTARDPFGNTATGYRGTIRFASTDPQATLPRNYAFTASDNGVRSFGAVLKTAATQSLTATDTGTGSITGTQSGIVVNPSTATGFVVLAPTTAVAGVPFDLYVIAGDAYGNVATGYRGTVAFFSLTDPDAALPGEYTFTAGDAGIASFFEGAALFTPGTQDLWVIDTTEPIFGTTLVEVMAGDAPGGGPGPGGGQFDMGFSDWLFALLVSEKRGGR